jgi:hypothetical protein
LWWCDPEKVLVVILAEPAFMKAKFHSNSNHWKWASEPNDREKQSFLRRKYQAHSRKRSAEFIHQSLITMKLMKWTLTFICGWSYRKMMIPHFNIDGKTFYMADLLPYSWLQYHLPYVMGYDFSC